DNDGAQAERQEAYEQDDRQRFDEGMDELVDRVVDDDRLIGDLLEIEALWNRGLEIGGRARYRRTELKDIGALRHDDADADRCFASLPDEKIRRVGIAVRPGGDVAGPEDAAARFPRRLCNRP